MERLSEACADAILSAFGSYHVRFKAVARRSQARFETCDWHGAARDARERLDMYAIDVRHTLARLEDLLGERLGDPEVWRATKRRVAEAASSRADAELAETFLNSITRRVFATVGVNPDIEFVASDARAPGPGGPPVFRTHEGGARECLERAVADVGFRGRFRDLAGELDLAAARVDAAVAGVDGLDVVKAPFYRNKGAYLVGRLLRGGEPVAPFVLALVNDGDGIGVDAVLVEENDVSIVFSFTRSYFLVEAERPRDLVAFLKAVMPRKPVSELYTAIGYNKHGKTELYRDLVRHLDATRDRFVPAPGTRGMVMCVFTLPSYDVVFKVIRDRFDHPKTSTRRDVLGAYDLVFTHDRAGRLVDTQEFELLTFRRELFTDEVLGELLAFAPSAVAVAGDEVVIRHLYTERRLTPLNLYVRSAPADRAADAVVDFGRAIKDLAAANVFPGDMLLKNFGVTRHGRVAFYDYDEVCLLTDCTFRRIPPSRTEEDELAAETWYGVGERDIFPEEFRSFLGLDGALREAFERAHADLYTVEFWRSAQERIAAGHIADVYPYRPELRLRGAPGRV
jgi:isocitrate dehydrogenase kinase/phosphatase